jgi:hypothetical protein
MRRRERRRMTRQRGSGFGRAKRAGRPSATVRAILCAALGHVAFSATFSPKEAPNWSEDVADFMPDERFLVFSERRATAVDTRGEGPGQVYEYEYDAQASTLTRSAIGEDGYNDNGSEENHEVEKTFYALNFYEYREGHVSLPASVTIELGLERTKLLGSDASGSNVFSSTFERLVLDDSDTQVDCCDARIWREGAEAGETHEQRAEASGYRRVK